MHPLHRLSQGLHIFTVVPDRCPQSRWTRVHQEPQEPESLNVEDLWRLGQLHCNRYLPPGPVRRRIVSDPDHLAVHPRTAPENSQNVPSRSFARVPLPYESTPCKHISAEERRPSINGDVWIAVNRASAGTKLNKDEQTHCAQLWSRDACMWSNTKPHWRAILT